MFQKEKSEIIHDAIVRSINDNSVSVTLLNNDCCSGCQSEKVCGIAGKEVKTLIIPGKFQLAPGNKVKVIMKLSDGYLALFFGYLLPLIIFISCLVVLSILSVGELYSGLIALGSLIPYYLIFSLFRKSVNTRFSFNISP